jgi:uncharacterized protein (DUF2141 family)
LTTPPPPPDLSEFSWKFRGAITFTVLTSEQGFLPFDSTSITETNTISASSNPTATRIKPHPPAVVMQKIQRGIIL